MVFLNAASSIATTEGISDTSSFSAFSCWWITFTTNMKEMLHSAPKLKEKQKLFKLFKPDTDMSSAKHLDEFNDKHGVYCTLEGISYLMSCQ